MEQDALNQVSEGHIQILGQAFEDFEKGAVHPKSGLGSIRHGSRLDCQVSIPLMLRDTLVESFEAGTIDNSTFSHPDHVYVIWSLIHVHGPLEAIRRFETSLKRITSEAGHPDKHNATITYALGFLTAERVAEDDSLTWKDFARRNPDLMEWPNEQLTRLYPDGSMHTEEARRAFILPEGSPRT